MGDRRSREAGGKKQRRLNYSTRTRRHCTVCELEENPLKKKEREAAERFLYGVGLEEVKGNFGCIFFNACVLLQCN